MTRKISILTAAYAPKAQYLELTAESVQAQSMPEGWEIEWIVQEDGEQSNVKDKFGDGRWPVRYAANGSHLGLAVTRNLALSRATGQLVQVLDHDDLLLPDAVATLSQRFVEHPIHWAVGQAEDLMPDGSRLSFPAALDFGVVPAGLVNEWAAARGGNWPVHCAGLMMRTQSVRALGGWAGLPAEDDISLFAALAQLAPGYLEEAVTWLYRQHAGQTYRTDEWRSRSETGRKAALQRVRAVVATQLSLAPEPLDHRSPEDDAVAPSIKTPRAV